MVWTGKKWRDRLVYAVMTVGVTVSIILNLLVLIAVLVESDIQSFFQKRKEAKAGVSTGTALQLATAIGPIDTEHERGEIHHASNTATTASNH